MGLSFPSSENIKQWTADQKAYWNSGDLNFNDTCVLDHRERGGYDQMNDLFSSLTTRWIAVILDTFFSYVGDTTSYTQIKQKSVKHASEESDLYKLRGALGAVLIAAVSLSQKKVDGKPTTEDLKQDLEKASGQFNSLSAEIKSRSPDSIRKLYDAELLKSQKLNSFNRDNWGLRKTQTIGNQFLINQYLVNIDESLEVKQSYLYLETLKFKRDNLIQARDAKIAKGEESFTGFKDLLQREEVTFENDPHGLRAATFNTMKAEITELEGKITDQEVLINKTADEIANPVVKRDWKQISWDVTKGTVFYSGLALYHTCRLGFNALRWGGSTAYSFATKKKATPATATPAAPTATTTPTPATPPTPATATPTLTPVPPAAPTATTTPTPATPPTPATATPTLTPVPTTAPTATTTPATGTPTPATATPAAPTATTTPTPATPPTPATATPTLTPVPPAAPTATATPATGTPTPATTTTAPTATTTPAPGFLRGLVTRLTGY